MLAPGGGAYAAIAGLVSPATFRGGFFFGAALALARHIPTAIAL